MESSASNLSAAAANQRRMQTLVDKLNMMRIEQRALTQKTAELESDATEHRLVIDALKEVDKNRTCYRLISGILVKQTVQEVLPDLEKNADLLKKTVATYHDNVKSKGEAINEFIQKNQLGSLLRLQNASDMAPAPSAESSVSGDKPDNKSKDDGPKSSVLVE